MHRRSVLVALFSVALIAPLPAHPGGDDNDGEPRPKPVKIRNYSLDEVARLPISRRKEILRTSASNSLRKDKTKPALTVAGLSESATQPYLRASTLGSVEALNAGIRQVQKRPTKNSRRRQAEEEFKFWVNELERLKRDLKRIEKENRIGWRLRAVTLKANIRRASASAVVFDIMRDDME